MPSPLEYFSRAVDPVGSFCTGMKIGRVENIVANHLQEEPRNDLFVFIRNGSVKDGGCGKGIEIQRAVVPSPVGRDPTKLRRRLMFS